MLDWALVQARGRVADRTCPRFLWQALRRYERRPTEQMLRRVDKALYVQFVIEDTRRSLAIWRRLLP